MAAPKLSPTELKKLFQEGDKDKNLQDKKIIEALQKRLNDMIQKDEKVAKKAALILENWLNKKTKP